LINSDITAATYWTTNPNNILTNNRAGGGEFYGFWYELFPLPELASINENICPEGINKYMF
jgi:hypothetical protein